MSETLLPAMVAAVESLIKAFFIERMVYLFCTIVAFGLMVSMIIVWLYTTKISWPQIAAIFSSSGVVAYTASKVALFLNKSLTAILKMGEDLSKRDAA